MPFLTAEWRKLAIANYTVDARRLAPFVPYGTELDLWNGQCYVSLVGFLFENTRLLGIRFPWHTTFEEVNLRFYVRRREGEQWRRGVTFIKEIVPRHAITLIANTIYKEHYETQRMAHRWEELNDQRRVEYRWTAGGRWQAFALKAARRATPIAPGSEAEFITEHYWGYTQYGPRKTYEYEVTHPRWEQYAVRDHTIAVDFERVYGRAWRDLNDAEPASVMLAEGSPITVESKRRLP